nr:hypothetical protein [Tanacetum cinerariifolium]
MCTRSSSNLPVESSPNPTSSNLKRRKRERKTRKGQNQNNTGPNQDQTGSVEKPDNVKVQSQSRKQKKRRKYKFKGPEMENPKRCITINKGPQPRWENDSRKLFAAPDSLIRGVKGRITTAMTAILKQFQATPLPASVKAVEEICVTCDGAHSYYQCLAAGGNTFPELRDNIQGYVAAAAVN